MSKILLRVSDVSYVYAGMEQPLFDKATFSIHQGERIGFLGFNGSGKTTLLDIVAGIKQPYSGEVIQNCQHIFYLRQEDYAEGDSILFNYLLKNRPQLCKIYETIKSIEKKDTKQAEQYADAVNEFKDAGGYEFIHRIEKTMAMLGFPPEAVDRNIQTLSGGERRLLKIATGFISDYDVFLLDEPTNYFDDRSIEYLMKGIRQMPGTFLIISHDRWFLDEVVHRIIEIEQRTAREYKGDYSQFYRTKQRELKEILKKRNKIQTQIKKLHDVKRTYTIWSKRTEKEKKGAYDKGRIGHKAAKLMKKATAARDRISEKIDELERSKPYIEKYYAFRFEKTQTHSGSCLSVNNLSKIYEKHTLFENLSFTVDWGEKICINGPNGSGKTTLLRILLGEQQPDQGEVFWNKLTNIGYLAQQWSTEQDRQRVTDVFLKKELERAHIFLGVLKVMVHGNVFDKRLGDLSEGQKRKVKLTQLLITTPNIVILDEPTTHLDYQTVEFLEQALKEYNGTVILVSHDRFLREQVVSREIILGHHS